MLARYIVARYGGNQVVWFLGGDGKYVEEYEQRWKTIGRGVFGRGDYQGLVAQHPKGLRKNNFTFCCRLPGPANPQKNRHRKLDNVEPAALRGAAAGGHLRRCRIG
jgi:hypothetical protein